MVRQSSQNGRPRAGAKAWGAKTWSPEIDAGRRSTGFLLPDGVVDAAGSLRNLISQWLAAEVAPGRLMPWLPVAFGFGIVVYFRSEERRVGKECA